MYEYHQLQQTCFNQPISYQNSGVVYQSVSNGNYNYNNNNYNFNYNSNNNCYNNNYFNQQNISQIQFTPIQFEPIDENALTYQNLQNSGFAYISDEQKEERVKEWLNCDKENCLYPIEF